ncbi:hypothetical protein HOS22_gp10 [Rhizobium phage RHEph08]|uniref:Uncharacterized protein n=2 Tax=Cuernavacavirus TaxID=2731935 RepID=L7TNP7_9CAUD|nr:hypothetical protein HOS22_gp10 [Rhizobium phage RHEph08]YP_009793249.1 hypothetical protein HOS23_gp07 [Rhizobium phage RHEph09]AGC35934.1 hypothetical protein RHEph08_gp010 [Rhizobium phage RHEph08]AGC35990.1 hypothetical protein RHEph09_gp007 [Rhizobium phage RHEph09]
MRISRVQGSIQVRVSFAEEDWRTAERSAYYTDCIEDAVIEGARMRKQKGYTREGYQQTRRVSVEQSNQQAVRRWAAVQARRAAREACGTNGQGSLEAPQGKGQTV